MLSSGVLCMAADPMAMHEDHLWPTISALLETAPAASAAALLHLCDPKGTSVLVSHRLRGERHDRALQ